MKNNECNVFNKVKYLYSQSNESLNESIDLNSQKSLLDRSLMLERNRTLKEVLNIIEDFGDSDSKNEDCNILKVSSNDMDILICALKNLQDDINNKINEEKNMKLLNTYCIHEEKVYNLIQKIISG